MIYPIKYDNKLAVNIDNDYKIRCTIFDRAKKNFGVEHYEIIEPVHEISNNVVCATSKASDQSLIRAFACRLSILRLLSY